jgi:hypothetical protein
MADYHFTISAAQINFGNKEKYFKVVVIEPKSAHASWLEDSMNTEMDMKSEWMNANEAKQAHAANELINEAVAKEDGPY